MSDGSENPFVGPSQDPDRPAKILIVDDEIVIHAVFEEFLADTGYELTAVTSAEEALERLKAESFDLAIIDKNLPGLSGLELMRVLRGVHLDLQFIMITAYGSLDTAVEALQLGAVDYIQKPFKDPALIVAKIVKALERAGLSALGARYDALVEATNAALILLTEACDRLRQIAGAKPKNAVALAPALEAIERVRNLLLSEGNSAARPQPPRSQKNQE